MNDYEYEFKQDIREKKSIGRNSRNMNRTGKGPIKFPSDYLTNKEKKKLSGPVKTYDMGKPISYTAFKELPVDIRREYFQGMLDKFQPTDEAICTMWGVSRGTPTNIRKLLGIKPIARKERVFNKDAWNEWLMKGGVPTTEDPVKVEKFVITPDPFTIPEQPVYISKDLEPEKENPEKFKVVRKLDKGNEVEYLADSYKTNFDMIAPLWSGYLARKGTELTAEDVAAMCSIMKLVEVINGKEWKDLWKEIAAYAMFASKVYSVLGDSKNSP